MTRIQIAGDIPLNGETSVQGSKNAVLPIMAAAVLHRGRTVLHNCPRILDVEYMADILRELGCLVEWHAHSLEIDAKEIMESCISPVYASRLRASVLLMGSLLGRCRRAGIPYPGGCSIGQRPIDLHLYAMERLGAEICDDCNMVWLDGTRLKGNEMVLGFPSVGATENAILAAVLAEGVTRICGCALEPEIADVCCFLNQKGACITGVGTAELVIKGVHELRDSEYTLMPDRIVAGTYLCAAAGTHGRILLQNVVPKQLEALIILLQKMGAYVRNGENWVSVDASSGLNAPELVETAPYPGFPTDLQSQMMAVMTKIQGNSRMSENLFEARFQTVKELRKMGAQIEIEDRTAFISGVSRLEGTQVTAYDLRGGAALVLAGLMAHGNTVVEGCHFIDRGYEDICGDLQRLGADICRKTKEGVNNAAANEKKKKSAENTVSCIRGSSGDWSGCSFRTFSCARSGCSGK